jgi:hypothetical protein
MPFAWTKKSTRVFPVQELPDTPQTLELPVLLHDKISTIKHKHAERLVSPRQKDDEAHEVKGVIQEGRRS